MAKKIRVEVCIMSARGLGRSSSLWKLQWFAVGWIDPNNKYCTKIDSSTSGNPTWRTKFSALIDDDSESDLQKDKDGTSALHVQVYSRDPIFLREKLQGTAIIVLKEFLAKYTQKKKNSPLGSTTGPGNEEVGSFQLRKKNSGKPQGFVDVSIRVSEQQDGGDDSYSHAAGDNEGFKLASPSIPENGGIQAYPSLPVYAPGAYPVPASGNYVNPSSSSYNPPPPPIPRAPTPPPPPPPSHVGYLPTFLPRTDQFPPATYINLPPSASTVGPPARTAVPPGFGMGMGMGMGAGALAAGAVIFGDDFMSGFDLPSGLQPQDASLTISTDPLF